MADRRMSERRDDEREEKAQESADERRGQEHDRRVLERFNSKAVTQTSEQLLFWLRIIFVVVASCGVFILGKSLSEGIRQAGPGILISIFMFSFAFYIYSTRKWIKTFLKNEAMTSFEVMYEKLTELVRFIALLAGFSLIIFIATSI